MAQAFGVEQGTRAQGSRVNPNNRPVTTPRGLSGIESSLGKIGTAISDAADDAQEKNVVTSIANARARMLEMELSGKSRVEVNTFREEAIGKIFKKFPAATTVNLVATGFRATSIASTKTTSDGRKANLDDKGNIISYVDQTPQEALQNSFENMAINTETTLPNFTTAGGKLATLGAAGGVDTSAMFVNATTAADTAIRTFNGAQGAIQQTLSNGTRENGKAHIDRAWNNTASSITNGLLQLADPMMLQLIADKRSGITPRALTDLANSYVNDWFRKLSDEKAFGLFGVDGNAWKAQMQSMLPSLTEAAEAAFNDDVKVRTKSATMLKLQSEMNTNNVLVNLANTNPRLFELMTKAPALEKVVNTMTMASGLANLYSTAGEETQSVVMEVISATFSSSTGIEFAASNLNDIPLATIKSAETMVKQVEILVNSESPYAWGKVRELLNNSTKMTELGILFEDAGRLPEFKEWVLDSKEWLGSLEEQVEETGIPLASIWQEYRDIRNVATNGGMDGLDPLVKPKPGDGFDYKEFLTRDILTDNGEGGEVQLPKHPGTKDK